MRECVCVGGDLWGEAKVCAINLKQNEAKHAR